VFPVHDHAVEQLDTTTVSRIGDLMRYIAGERAGAVIPAFSLFRVRLQIAASRATISRDLVQRTVLRLYSAPKRLLRFAWLPCRHNAGCVIFVVENKPLFHFAVAFRTLIVRFHHLLRINYLGERPEPLMPASYWPELVRRFGVQPAGRREAEGLKTHSVGRIWTERTPMAQFGRLGRDRAHRPQPGFAGRCADSRLPGRLIIYPGRIAAEFRYLARTGDLPNDGLGFRAHTKMPTYRGLMICRFQFW
jgi:hypothetical protein